MPHANDSFPCRSEAQWASGVLCITDHVYIYIYIYTYIAILPLSVENIVCNHQETSGVRVHAQDDSVDEDRIPLVEKPIGAETPLG